MTQSPFPSPPDSIQVSVPLPSGVEQWLDQHAPALGAKLAVFLLGALLLYLLARLARRMVGENIEDVNRGHSLRKAIGYGYVVLLVLFAVALFAERLTGLGTMLAVLVAGIAVALQDILKSFVGWLYLSSRSGIEVGSRVEVGGVIGDVIDVGVLKTTMLEVGNLVYGRQATGRLVTIPNSRMISESVFVSARFNPFVWQEVRVTVTLESDWRRAEEILKGVGDELYAEISAELEKGFARMRRRFAFKPGKTTPIVYVSLADSGVELTLRVLTYVRRRRGVVDRISRRVLEALASEPAVRLAYPARRVYTAVEERVPFEVDGD